MKSIVTMVLAATVLVSHVQGFAATVKTTALGEKVTREDLLSSAIGLSASEEEREQAKADLQKYPRAKVIALLKAEFAKGEPKHSHLYRVVATMKLTELAPELQKLAEKSRFWGVFAALNALGAKNDAEKTRLLALYVARLKEKGFPQSARLAVIEGLTAFKSGLPLEQLKELVNDDINAVAEAAIGNYIETRSQYSGAVARERLKAALTVRSAIARSMVYASVSAEGKSLVTGEGCAKEARAFVKSACERALERMPASAGGGK